MIDLERENPVTLAAAPQCVPAIDATPGMAGRRLHQRTIYNWATRGKRGVILETLSIGGILVTSREALQRFFNRLSEQRRERFADSRSDVLAPRRRRITDGGEARRRLAAAHGI